MRQRTEVSFNVIFFISLILASQAYAQIPQPSDTTSVPIAGAGHDYLSGPADTVNPANGSVSIRIPAILPPSRGITLPFSFMYDSSVYYLSGNRYQNAQWARISSHSASNGFASSEGWSSAQPIVSATEATWKEIDPVLGTNITCHYTFGYIFQDATGTRHNLNLTNFYQDPNTDCAADVDVTAPEGFNGQVVAQGSEGPIMGSIPAAWTSPTSTGAAQVTVTDGDGTVYSFSGTFPSCSPPCSVPFYPHLNSVTDRNGNIITITYPSNVATYKDTSARTVLTDSGFAINPETVTVSGLGAGYTVNWTTQSNPTFSSSIGIQALNGTTCAEPLAPLASTPSVSSITLPNGRSYAFAYDTAYGLVNKIVYPSNGYVRYKWGQNLLSHYGEFTPNNISGNTCQMHYAVPAITDRWVSFDGTTEVLHQTFSYSTTWSSSDPSTWTSKTTTVTTTDLLRNTSFTTVYTYNPIPLPLTPSSPTNYQDPHAANPVEFTVVYKDTNGSVLKTVTKHWRNERLLLDQTNSYPTGPANETAWNYDSNEMQIEKDDYDFGTSGVGALLRKSVTTYAASSTFTTNHILDKPAKIRVYDSTGTGLAAETDYAYDTPAATVTSGIVQHSGGCKCGNLTSSSSWLNSSGSTLTSTFTNDDTGQRLSATDPRGNTTSYSYTDSYSSGTPPGPTNTYLTTVTHPVTGNVNHIDKYAYAYASGDVTSSTDQNNLVTNYKYVDNLSRLTETDFPDGGTTTIAYNDAAYNPTTPSPSVTTTKKINGTTSQVTVSAMDGLGHVVRTELTSDPQGTDYTDTVYDGMGRVKSVSNPYRSATDPTSSTGTTSVVYDALGRKISETAPDGAVIATAYCAGSTLVTDPTNRWRRSRTDGLGRLVEVDEPNATGATVAPTGCPGTGEPIWVTSYTVDALGNLTQVVQNGSHQRTFTYDLLSRLKTANNPETGTVTYNYDSDTSCSAPNSFAGLLVSKVDGRNIRSCAKYDALNRETSLSYSNNDPTVTTTYDQSACLGLTSCANTGHRTSVTDAAGSELWSYQVDFTNHRSVHKNQRTTSGVTKSTTYYLDLGGNLTSITYPTGRIVNYTYNAANRPITAQDSANGITYATAPSAPLGGCLTGAVCYTPQGSIYSMSIGQTTSFTGLNISETFNNRLQPSEIKASSSAGTAMDLTYSFLDGTTLTNAGHVGNIVNNLDNSRSQGFAYDQVSRLTGAGTFVDTGSNCWGYQYNYDAWGNLLAQAGWTKYYSACTESTMGAVTADNSNHITGLTYDASGNALSDGVENYTWNAESQLKNSGGVNYQYDSDGRRAAKVASKVYWYGSGGEILAETDASGTTAAEYIFFAGRRIALLPAGANAQYYVEDFLGSSRVVTQNTGTVCYDADFPPFGQERIVTNTCTQNKYKFEGKERDSETGNDYFGARYYSWRFGRWLSADWSSVPVPVPYANLTNPQTLNLYSMVAEDPESFADLDGHGAIALEDSKEDSATGIDALSCAGHGESCESAEESAATQSQVQAYKAKEQAQASGQAQNSSSGCGWCQKLANKLSGNGWKTDQQIAQENINLGMPPNGEYSFLTGRSCPDCKYYPKEVSEGVYAHEDQHRKDEHTWSGFKKLYSKEGQRELEVNAFKAELSVVERNIKAIEGKGPPTVGDGTTLRILYNMKYEAEGVIAEPKVYIP